jgi:poly-gamma-glutamate capsule biosynthesis protein CapA/YwtB (metallophosphatase superfamily)
VRLRVFLALSLALAFAGGCGSSSPTLTIARLSPALGGGLAAPSSWIEAYGRALGPAAGTPAPSLDPSTSADAATSVRDGRARYALTTAADAAGLAQAEFDAVPVALVVPLTFPVDDLTSDEARSLVSGRARDWSVVGGPHAPVDASLAPGADAAAVARALGIERMGETVSAPAAVGPAPGLLIAYWSGPALDRKALRIDGTLPGDAGYPFVERRVVAGRSGDDAAVSLLAAELRTAIANARPAEVTLDAVGDIMLGRSIARLMADRGAAYPFEAVRPALADADVRFGNLEMALTDRGTPARKDYVFRAPPAATDGLSYAGFNVVSLANNHSLDYGPEGLADTITALDRAGIAHAGAGSDTEQAHAPALLTVKGVRIAVLAYVNVPNDSRSGFVAQSMEAGPGRPGVAWGTVDAVQRDVAAAKQQADVVIVSLHSGYEYTDTPNPTQRALAHAAVDAGAALVLGGHPHVLQGVEFYHGVPIIYSLGNFVFDLDHDDYSHPGLPSTLTVIFRVTLTKDGVQGVRFIPAVIDPRDGRPAPASGADARRVLDRLDRLIDALR